MERLGGGGDSHRVDLALGKDIEAEASAGDATARRDRQKVGVEDHSFLAVVLERVRNLDQRAGSAHLAGSVAEHHRPAL